MPLWPSQLLADPGLGLEHLMHQWGFEGFSFDWLVNPDMARYQIESGIFYGLTAALYAARAELAARVLELAACAR